MREENLGRVIGSRSDWRSDQSDLKQIRSGE